MDLASFVHQLQYDLDAVRPPDAAVDWLNAALPYKLYRGLPSVPFAGAIPLDLSRAARSATQSIDIDTIGHLLWYTYGITQFAQLVYAPDAAKPADGLMHLVRRYAPSGGALYPNELYLYLRCNGTQNGIYHYDVAHHRLLLLRAGDYDEYVTHALGGKYAMSDCFAVVFVSTMFRKNFYKYRDFSYRLQCLDTGVVLEQLRLAARAFGFHASICMTFLDAALNHMIGVTPDEESVYAAVPLSVDPLPVRRLATQSEIASDGFGVQGTLTAEQLCRALEPIAPQVLAGHRGERASARLLAMHQASMCGSLPQDPGCPGRDAADTVHEADGNVRCPSGSATVQLPRVKRITQDFASTCRRRCSPGLDFVLQGLDMLTASALLQEAQVTGGAELYACFTGVEDVPDGAYAYDAAPHLLRQIRAGDCRARLHEALSMLSVNVYQVPICLHVVGDIEASVCKFGFRGYRMVNMEAGMLVQRVALASASLGLGAHPLLGYDAVICDDIYRLKQPGKTTLIQIPVGYYRTASRLQGHTYES